MYVPEPDKRELRQGDIIAAVWFPRIKFEDIRVIASVDRGEREKIVATPGLTPPDKSGMEWTVTQIQMTRRFVMVLTQCCDLERDQNGRARGLGAVMAPLVPVPDKYARKLEVLAALRSNPIDKYLNLFFIEKQDPLPSDFIVDFGRVVSIGLDQYQHLLDHKVLQLKDEIRILLKSKLALNFGRLTVEEERAGFKLLVPPGNAELERPAAAAAAGEGPPPEVA